MIAYSYIKYLILRLDSSVGEESPDTILKNFGFVSD